jgi:DNA-binding LytR/AlgR family response regulator
MLRELDRDIRVINVLDSVEASVQFLKNAPLIDLILMDIELGDGESFEIFNSVQIEAPVIFITAYQQHTLKAFKQNSVDYLLKPLSKVELEAALLKYKRTHCSPLQPADKSSYLHSNGSSFSRNGQKKRFLTRIGTRLLSVPADNIAYFYTKDKLLYIKTKTGEDLVFDKRLDEVESEVDGQYFFRANRQFILHYDAIEKVHAWFGGKLKVQVKPAPCEDVIISRLKAPDFKKWLGE